MDLRSLQLVALARGAYGPSAPLTSAGIRAIQRTAGNRAACQVIKVQRLQHPDFPKKAAEMNDMELLKAYRFNVEGDTFGIGLPPADLAAVRSEMRRRRIPETSTNPLDDHRDLLPIGATSHRGGETDGRCGGPRSWQPRRQGAIHGPWRHFAWRREGFSAS